MIKKIKRKRKNPIDFSFLRKIGITIPIGIPDEPKEAFKLGLMFGKKRIIELCDGSLIDIVFKLPSIQRLTKKYFTDKIFDSKLPSDAFMMGIQNGILEDAQLCNGGHKSFERRGFLFAKIVNDPLYKKYVDTRTNLWIP